MTSRDESDEDGTLPALSPGGEEAVRPDPDLANALGGLVLAVLLCLLLFL